MSAPAVTARPYGTVGEARALLAKHRIGRLPVVDRDDRLIGIVNRPDLSASGLPAGQRCDGPPE